MIEQEEKWEEDEDTYDEDLEFVQLDVGDTIQGVIMEVIPSKKFVGRNTYKIQTKESKQPILLFGTSMLDRKLQERVPGDEVKIIRESDIPTDKGNPLQVYKTFHRKAVQEQTKKADGGIFGSGL